MVDFFKENYKNPVGWVQVLRVGECDWIRVRGIPGVCGVSPHDEKEAHHRPSGWELLRLRHGSSKLLSKPLSSPKFLF